MGFTMNQMLVGPVPNLFNPTMLQVSSFSNTKYFIFKIKEDLLFCQIGTYILYINKNKKQFLCTQFFIYFVAWRNYSVLFQILNN